MLQVFATPQRRLAFEQPGAGHWREVFAKQALCTRWCAAGLGVAQGQVHIAGVQVYRHVGGVNANVDTGVPALKIFQPGYQPHGGKGGGGGEGDALPPSVAPQALHGAVELGQRGAHRLQQLRPGAGKFYGAGVAQEQADAHVVLQRLNLPGDCALGQR